MRNNYLFCVAFTVTSKNAEDDLTDDEILDAMQRRVTWLEDNPTELREAIGMADDVYEVSDEDDQRTMNVAFAQMKNSCTSEGDGVRDILETIRSNGGESATREHLVACAQEIRDWAQFFMDENR